MSPQSMPLGAEVEFPDVIDGARFVRTHVRHEDASRIFVWYGGTTLHQFEWDSYADQLTVGEVLFLCKDDSIDTHTPTYIEVNDAVVEIVKDIDRCPNCEGTGRVEGNNICTIGGCDSCGGCFDWVDCDDCSGPEEPDYDDMHEDREDLNREVEWESPV